MRLVRRSPSLRALLSALSVRLASRQPTISYRRYLIRGLSRFIATDPTRRYTRPWIAKTISMYLASSALRVIAADRSFGVDRRPRENLARRKRANARSQRCVRRDAASRRVTSRHVTSRHVTSGSVEWIGRNESRIRLPVRASYDRDKSTVDRASRNSRTREQAWKSGFSSPESPVSRAD